MKTALLLTNSADTQRLLTEMLGEKTNFVLLPPPADPTREKFDALFAIWLRLADAVILDAASIGEPSRWAIESLAAAKVEERQAVVVRATAQQQALYPMASHWLTISESDSAEQLKQSLGTFFELRDAQAKLKRADSIIARQRQMTPPPPDLTAYPRRASSIPAAAPAPANSSFDSYRYRAAVKSISQLLSRHVDRETLWPGLLSVVQELFSVGKAAIFTREPPVVLGGVPAETTWASLAVAASAGIAKEVVQHLRMTADAGIGG
jgi:hypothetical protein